MTKPNTPHLIGILDGEGIGPELMHACRLLLRVIEDNTAHRFEIRQGGAIGLIAWRESGQVLTPAVVDFCAQIFNAQGAILCGPGGGRFVYELRQKFDLYYKLVPLVPLPVLHAVSSIKANKLAHVDILIVRENMAGVYQGESLLTEQNGVAYASHQFSYNAAQIKRILNIAIELTLTRRKKLTVILKPGGVPAISTLWKSCAEELVLPHTIELQFLEVDNAAYQMIHNAQAFDVVVAPNMFGDILADGATALLGSRGLSYSANFGDNNQAVYQTGHGAAYDLAGTDTANPLGQIFSLSALLRDQFGLTSIAAQLHEAIISVLQQGFRTADISDPGCTQVGTQTLTQHIARELEQRLMSTPYASAPNQRPALLLMDLQHDFIARLADPTVRHRLIDNASRLLDFCRQQAIPVLHVLTQVKADGSDSMPHWKRDHYIACREGSIGVNPPIALQPIASEPIFLKQYFNGFHATHLHETLQTLNIDTLIICGLYLHGCIRATAISAYEYGYQVCIAEDAVASTEPMHAKISQDWLSARAACFSSVAAIQQQLSRCAVNFPSGVINHQAVYATPAGAPIINFSPADAQTIHTAFMAADRMLCDAACVAAENAWHTWRHAPMQQRAAVLTRWRDHLLTQESRLLDTLITEIGKPWQDAKAELTRAFNHLAHTLATREDEPGARIQVQHRPYGVYALITPWNNPLALPISKIAPALLFGNSVVWKAAPEAPRTAKLLMDTLIEADLPCGVVNLILGDKDAAQTIITHPSVHAVTLTGSVATGKKVAARCGMLGKPLQAELGGNNPCIILADVDIESIIEMLVLSAFGFCGQRCTAIRRFIVEACRVEAFTQHFVSAMQRLTIGLPQAEQTQIGPVLNLRQIHHIEAVIANAVRQGAQLIAGGNRITEFSQGYWFEPTLLMGMPELSAVVQQETFGPLALIQPAVDIQDAVRLANNVPHGLFASLLTHDSAAQTYFKQHIEAGIIKLNPDLLRIEAHVPFGGWKESQYGLPEHGEWDKLFYTRPQTVYG